MNQQHARIKTNQQIFGAAAAFAHHQPAQDFGQRGRNLPTQFGLADGYGTDGLVDDVRGDAAQGGFYFGEFGHGGVSGCSFGRGIIREGCLKIVFLVFRLPLRLG